MWPFKSRKKGRVGPEPTLANTLSGSQATRQRILHLGENVLNASLAAEGALLDAWKAQLVLGGDPNSWKASWVVRTEMLFFFLHLMDRWAFQYGGRGVADMFLSVVSTSALQSTVSASWASPPSGHKQVLRGRMVEELLEDFNNATEDYSTCEQLASDSDSFNDASVLGKLCARIAREVELPHSHEFRLLVSLVSTEILVKSGLKNQVEEACNALR